MSFTYTKLFSSITESTVWCEPYHVRILWVSMLAMADKRGRVWGSVPGLARRAGITLDECEDALGRFMAPDKYSRTPDNEGRRIEQIAGGWALLNYEHYRGLKDEEDKRDADAERKRRQREREKTGEAGHEPPMFPGEQSHDDVTERDSHAGSQEVAQAEAKAEKEGKRTGGSGAPPAYPAEFEDAWVAYPKRIGDNPKGKAFEHWNARRKSGHTAAELHEGVKRYAAYCDRADKTGTEYVMQAKRFFGKDKPFLNAWDGGGSVTPLRRPQTQSIEEQNRAANEGAKRILGINP